ncbi:MAG: 30S ribosomal protein S5 [bacterium]
MTDIQNTNTAPVEAPQGNRPMGQGSRPPFQRRPFPGNRPGGPSRGGDGKGGRDGRRPGGRSDRPRSEYDSKILAIRRVARVATGGRRFNFSVAIVIGNRKGQVGVGLGKANDTAAAIDKATRDAKKNMVTISTTKSMSIPHNVESKYCSARVVIYPAPGRGVIAGSAIRNIIELAGVKDINAKILSGSKNKLNIARAAIAAFKKLAKVKAKPVVVKAEVKAEATEAKK